MEMTLSRPFLIFPEKFKAVISCQIPMGRIQGKRRCIKEKKKMQLCNDCLDNWAETKGVTWKQYCSREQQCDTMDRSWHLELESLFLNLSFPAYWLQDLELVTICLGLSFSIYKMETLMFISQGCSEALRTQQMWHRMWMYFTEVLSITVAGGVCRSNSSCGNATQGCVSEI